MLKIVTHDSLTGRLNRLLYWLFLVIEQLLDQLVPGGEILALSLVHPLRWRSEDPDTIVSMKSLVSDLAGSALVLLQFSYAYRGIVAFHAWLGKEVSNRCILCLR
jgi:hypothetical protein